MELETGEQRLERLTHVAAVATQTPLRAQRVDPDAEVAAFSAMLHMLAARHGLHVVGEPRVTVLSGERKKVMVTLTLEEAIG